MKHITLTYLGDRFFHRIRIFLRNWYVNGIRVFTNAVLSFLERLDRYFAWKITAKNLFKPLFKDYSFLGYILGFFFRIFRLLAAGLVYAGVFVVAILLGALWAVFPLFVVYKIFSPLW